MPLSKKETREFLQRSIDADNAISAALVELEKYGMLINSNFESRLKELEKSFDSATAIGILQTHNSWVEKLPKHQGIGIASGRQKHTHLEPGPDGTTPDDF